jgi:hypothetical protein
VTQAKRLRVISDRSLRNYRNNLSLTAKVLRKRRSKQLLKRRQQLQEAAKQRLAEHWNAMKWAVLTGA